MSFDGNRVGSKRSRSRSRSPRRHKHGRDHRKRRSKEREREAARFDPHKRIKQEPVSPPPRNRDLSPPPRHRDRDVSPPSRQRDDSPPPRHRDVSPPSHHHRANSPPQRHRRSPDGRRSSPHRDRPRSGRDRPHSGRNHFRDEDDSSRRERHHHFDGQRPIKREPEDRPDLAQRQERERNDNRRRRARWEREENNNSQGSSGSGGASSSNQNWGAAGATGAKPAEKEKPNFELSGKLAEDTNVYNGVVIKYNEPPEARKPKRQWRFYPFKAGQELPVLYIHRQSAYLIGRNRRIADFPVDHPSCSSQHAVLQYRLVNFTRPDGTAGRRVSPFIIDLNSTNGTYLNNQLIESQRYVELREKDVLKFGYSTKEYVLLTATSDTTEVMNEDES